jgi:hypothetical protein
VSPLGPPGAVKGFPVLALGRGRTLWRIHRRAASPWWFNSSCKQRFDLPPPHGTCYLAEWPLGSFVEVFREPRVVARADIDARALSRVRLPRSVSVADATSRRARRFGITLEIGVSDDYELTQAWARALFKEGFGGIRYRLRHDPAGSLVGIALFGNAGEAAWRYDSRPIDERLVAEAQARFGIVVLPATLP